jgi:hypothetical protein
MCKCIAANIVRNCTEGCTGSVQLAIASAIVENGDGGTIDIRQKHMTLRFFSAAQRGYTAPYIYIGFLCVPVKARGGG